jgi:hypothetical protein
LDKKENTNGFNQRRIILDSELILNNQGQISRTCNPTGHSLLICTYIELPFDLTEEESKELAEKLEILDKKVNKNFSFFSISFFPVPLCLVVLISPMTL